MSDSLTKEEKNLINSLNVQAAVVCITGRTRLPLADVLRLVNEYYPMVERLAQWKKMVSEASVDELMKMASDTALTPVVYGEAKLYLFRCHGLMLIVIVVLIYYTP